MDCDVLVHSSPIGTIYCLFEGKFLIDLSIKDAKGLQGTAHSLSPIACHFFQELDAYFKGDLKEFNQEIKFVSGTDFEREVWIALRDIPYGETRSYKWLAERVGSPMAVRAVGQALKKNLLPIILPCHRVIASDGSLGGFSCGVEIKRWLLRHEGLMI
ncbi:MAG: methylated-DNA--[protein]-cysteine S-methyltransferase [Thermodesulfovibrionales bacterium]|nr:methylated-DNA--[protein]-cysteine S-methyltransferase [Thermodesulfovibrionales bacterium]